jgi:hypothetical protein
MHTQVKIWLRFQSKLNFPNKNAHMCLVTTSLAYEIAVY